MNESPAAYPIEIEPPDIKPYQTGSHDIDYVHTFDSGQPGKHVVLNALTHGNEYCGAIVLKELLDLELRPRTGTLTLSFANVAAFESFDPSKPDKSRYVDEDLNRVWSASRLDDHSRTSIELTRARQLRSTFEAADWLLDIHSMHEKSQPLGLSGPLDKGVDFAHEVGRPKFVVRDVGHTEGTRLRDFGKFGDASSDAQALLIECGQHWERESLLVARDCAARFLALSDVVTIDDLPSDWYQNTDEQSEIVEVTGAVVAKSMQFNFADSYSGLETFAAAGTVIAWDDGEPVTTPHDDCVLIMPSLRQLHPGVTVVRFGRRETRS